MLIHTQLGKIWSESNTWKNGGWTFVEAFVLVKCYAAFDGSWLTTFRESNGPIFKGLGLHGPWRWDRQAIPKRPVTRSYSTRPSLQEDRRPQLHNGRSMKFIFCSYWSTTNVTSYKCTNLYSYLATQNYKPNGKLMTNTTCVLLHKWIYLINIRCKRVSLHCYQLKKNTPPHQKIH